MQASREADVVVTDCRLTSDGKLGILLDSAAKLRLETCEVLTFNLSSTAIYVTTGASAIISSSQLLSSGTGVRCKASSSDNSTMLVMWESAVRGRETAVRASKAHVDIARECLLEAEKSATVVASRECTLLISDSELRAGNSSALVAQASRVELLYNKLKCSAGCSSAGIVLNRVHSGSVLTGNTAIGPMSRIYRFVDDRIQGRCRICKDTEQMRHPRLGLCDVLRVLCAAPRMQDTVQRTPERVATVPPLRELRASEVPVVTPSKDTMVQGAAAAELRGSDANPVRVD